MLHAVILAGGSGTRFWPRSRRDLPKQFLALTGARTLLQQTYDRLSDWSESVVVVTREDLSRGVSEQLQELPREAVMIEPEARDTAAAIGLAAAVSVGVVLVVLTLVLVDVAEVREASGDQAVDAVLGVVPLGVGDARGLSGQQLDAGVDRLIVLFPTEDPAALFYLGATEQLVLDYVNKLGDEVVGRV